jgi:hypothetical protein
MTCLIGARCPFKPFRSIESSALDQPKLFNRIVFRIQVAHIANKREANQNLVGTEVAKQGLAGEKRKGPLVSAECAGI